MKSKIVVTSIINDTIFSKLEIDGKEMNVLTVSDALHDPKFKTFIRSYKAGKLGWEAEASWNLTAKINSYALMNHVALTKMVLAHQPAEWSGELLRHYMPMSEVKSLVNEGVYSDESNFDSTFTHRLFNAAGLCKLPKVSSGTAQHDAADLQALTL